MQRLHPWRCSARGQSKQKLTCAMFITPPKLIKSFDLFCICLRKKTPCAAPLRAPVAASCGAAKCKLQWRHLAVSAGIKLHCVAPHKKTHATTDLQCACNGLKRQSTGTTMTSIDAAASPSWQLLRQCHCNRVTPPHFVAFTQTKKTKCAVAPADCSGGVPCRQFE